MSVNIQESIKAILRLGDHQRNLEAFARKSFDDWRFSEDYNKVFIGRDNIWTRYIEFIILSENEIQINYEYGDDDSLFGVAGIESFVVNILPEVRDNKIDEIINN